MWTPVTTLKAGVRSANRLTITAWRGSHANVCA